MAKKWSPLWKSQRMLPDESLPAPSPKTGWKGWAEPPPANQESWEPFRVVTALRLSGTMRIPPTDTLAQCQRWLQPITW